MDYDKIVRGYEDELEAADREIAELKAELERAEQRGTERVAQAVERLADEYEERSADTENAERYPWGVAADDLRALLAEHRDERLTPEPPSDVTEDEVLAALVSADVLPTVAYRAARAILTRFHVTPRSQRAGASTSRAGTTGCSTCREVAPEPPSDIADIVSEALTDALHPEFGTEWREPDGVIYKAVMQEHYRTVKYAGELVATFRTVEEAASALKFIGEKGLENV